MSDWHKRGSETNKAYAAFVIYRDLGHNRSLQKAANQYYGKSAANVRQLERWSSQHDWVARVAAYDEHQRREHERVVAEQFAADREKHRAQRQKLLDLMNGVVHEVTRTYFPDAKPGQGKPPTTMSAQDFNALMRGIATMMDQSRAEFNDLPAQRMEHAGHDGGAIVFRTGMDVDEL